MVKALIKTSLKIIGMHSGIKGEVSIYLSGDVSGLSGDVTGLSGDVTGLHGYVTGLRGYVTDNALTPKERKNGIDISKLVKAEGA